MLNKYRMDNNKLKIDTLAVWIIFNPIFNFYSPKFQHYKEPTFKIIQKQNYYLSFWSIIKDSMKSNKNRKWTFRLSQINWKLIIQKSIKRIEI